MTRRAIALVSDFKQYYSFFNSIVVMLQSNKIYINLSAGCPLHESPICLYPGLPTLTTDDLPWLIGSSAARISRFKFWSRTLDRSINLKWLLMNTFLMNAKKNSLYRQVFNNISKLDLLISTRQQERLVSVSGKKIRIAQNG